VVARPGIHIVPALATPKAQHNCACRTLLQVRKPTTPTMAEVDFLITNGTIVDGTDEPAFQGDVAIKDGTIVAVGDR
jgi:adenine deaminase